jgi:hypothetical protein
MYFDFDKSPAARTAGFEQRIVAATCGISSFRIDARVEPVILLRRTASSVNVAACTSHRHRAEADNAA